MPPSRSYYWKYFVRTSEGGKCNICQQLIKTSGNTTNLRFHLLRTHSELQFEMKKTNNTDTDSPDTTNNMTRSSMVSTSKKAKKIYEDEDDINMDYDDIDVVKSVPSPSLSVISTVSDSQSEVSISSVKKKKQTTIDLTFQNQKSFHDGGTKAAKYTNNLIFMIAKDNLPFATVEKEGFQRFTKAIAPLYKIPSRKTITNLVEEKYKFLSSMIKTQFSNIKHLCLTTDIWTETLNTKSYLGITSHYILEETYKSVTIGVIELDDRHTSDNIKMWLLNMIRDWNIDIEAIVIVVSDNAANIKKAIVEAFGSEKYLPCFAHTLNLIPASIIRDDNTVSEFCKKIKNIVTYFKHSVVATDELRAQSTLKLIQSVETRWNSTYNMLERFIELEDKISSILLQQPTAPIMLTASELHVAKEFVQLLKPFDEATKIICGEHYLTGSKVIPIVNTLRNKLSLLAPQSEIGIHLKFELERQFSKRFSSIERVQPLAISTILDPRFKNINFSDKIACAYAINKITLMLNSNEETTTDYGNNVENDSLDNDNFWMFHEDLVKCKRLLKNNDPIMADELKYYLNQQPIKMIDSPLKYWLNMHLKLKNIALKYLSIIATSVPSERLFSRAGNIITESRNRLTGEHLQQLLFLNSLSTEDWLLDL